MQSKQELENWWSKEDAWGYKTNPDDQIRKDKIIEVVKGLNINSILDIGAGEGWVTKDLPAKEIYATEIADNARARFPDKVKEWKGEEVEATITMGTLYPQYNHAEIAETLKKATKYIIVAGIDSWLIDYDFGKIVHTETYPYREFKQRLTVYEVSS